MPYSRHRRLIIFTGVMLVFVILATIGFRYAGIWLVKQDTFQPTDAIVVLMGSTADRVLETYDLYRAGISNKVFIVNNIQVGSEALISYGIRIPTFAVLCAQALADLGIPDSLVMILPGASASTRDEADTIAAYIRTNAPDIKSVMLVSSSAHLRRASLIFEDVFRDHDLKVKVYCAPSKYSGFQADRWWKYRENAKDVFTEYVKILFFVLIEKWK